MVSVGVLIIGNLRIRHGIKRNSALTFEGGVLRSHAFEIGGHATSDMHDVCRPSTEVVIPRSHSCPHLIVLQQVRIHKDSQLSCMTKGREATVGFGD